MTCSNLGVTGKARNGKRDGRGNGNGNGNDKVLIGLMQKHQSLVLSHQKHHRWHSDRNYYAPTVVQVGSALVNFKDALKILCCIRRQITSCNIHVTGCWFVSKLWLLQDGKFFVSTTRTVHLRAWHNTIGSSSFPFPFQLPQSWEGTDPLNLIAISIRHPVLFFAGSGIEHSWLRNEPELRHFQNLVACKIPGKWQDVGVQLGLEEGELRAIAKSAGGDWMRCFTSVFTAWRNRRTWDFSWETVVSVLRSTALGEIRLADEVSSSLGSHQS